MASPDGVTVALTVAVSFAAMVGMVVGSKVTSQPLGGVAVTATPVSGAVPVLVTSKEMAVGPPAEPLAERRSSGVDRVIEYEPVISTASSALTMRSPAVA